jgi:tetratricopeptide (TPR) repeat protein
MNTDLSRASALKNQGRTEEAIAVYRQVIDREPSNGLALYNLAAALGDMGAFEETLVFCDRALAASFDRAETWLVRARALTSLGRFDAARQSFESALQRSPTMLAAVYELSQLIWMFTGDAEQTLEPLDVALKRTPNEAGLLFTRAKVLEFMGEIETACDAMCALAEARPGDLPPVLAASYLCAQTGDAKRALGFANRALMLSPGTADALSAHASACLAAGHPADAARSALQLHQANPLDQNAIALLATAWRAEGDPRGDALYDYGQFVRTARIAPPSGWTDLETYLADLASELNDAHAFSTHPFGQSVRHGSQRQDVLKLDSPAIRAFTNAIDPVLLAMLDAFGSGPDPLRSRNTGRWRCAGAWSVKLPPGGFHHDHIHSRGWLSSAFYVELPPCIDEGGKEGWLRFGQPGIPVNAEIEAGHVIRPEPGLLAVFPSYMWHGTVPFSTGSHRLTIALDIVPG